MKKDVGIVGHGFVGKAVEYGFDTPEVRLGIADFKYSSTARDLFDPRGLEPFIKPDFNPSVVFICVPTPMGPDGSIDASILLEVCEELRDYGNGCVAVIKSTVTPDKLRECFDLYENLVYSPEFLRERTANENFVNPDMHVFGADRFAPASEVVALYNEYSKCAPCPHFLVKPEVASLIKYTINSFLATKVTFFNELYDLMNNMGLGALEYKNLIEVLSFDPRIGESHMQVPGPDGRRGFGGACFAKDTAAFSKFSELAAADFMLLNEAVKINSHYRRQYDKLDEREKEQNVQYGLTGT